MTSYYISPVFSQAYRKIDVTRERISRILELRQFISEAWHIKCIRLSTFDSAHVSSRSRASSTTLVGIGTMCACICMGCNIDRQQKRCTDTWIPCFSLEMRIVAQSKEVSLTCFHPLCHLELFRRQHVPRRSDVVDGTLKSNNSITSSSRILLTLIVWALWCKLLSALL